VPFCSIDAYLGEEKEWRILEVLSIRPGFSLLIAAIA